MNSWYFQGFYVSASYCLKIILLLFSNLRQTVLNRGELRNGNR